MNFEPGSTFEERAIPYAVVGAAFSPIPVVPVTVYETYHYGLATAVTVATLTLLVSPSIGFGFGVIAKFGIEKFADLRQRARR